jgi:phosphopantetheinyl transferase
VAVFVGASGPVGVDVETERPGEAWRGLMTETFHIQELSCCGSITKPAFYRYWVAKGAVANTLGTGLA